MLYQIYILVLCLLNTVDFISSCSSHKENSLVNDTIPLTTRNYWMRAANQALSDLHSPCPFGAFGTVIVNHSAPGLGELVCMGINRISSTGNPTMHGEIAAIGNCSKILTAKLGVEEALKAFSQLSIYTNGEICPMCAAAIRWTGFREYIYGTSIGTLIKEGFNQIEIESHEIFAAAKKFPSSLKIIPNILINETDPLFKWQFNPEYPCPKGCHRPASGEGCVPFSEK